MILNNSGKIKEKYDVVIIGAGAAGLMCAIHAGKRGRKVLLLDHSKSVGEKIRISGGGRCNFTNIHTSIDNYISNNPYFAISALKRYTQFDFIDMVEEYNIPYHEKTLGQLFCDNSAKDIIDTLLSQCKEFGVDIFLRKKVVNIEKESEYFCVKFKGAVGPKGKNGKNSKRVDEFESSNVISESLVVATGGLSVPKIGATSFGYDIARKFGLKIIEPTAALVPFAFSGEMLRDMKELSGVSLGVIVSCGGKEFEEAMLFTHRGLSGPAILQISSYWKKGDYIDINLLPKENITTLLKSLREEGSKREVLTILSAILPKRLAKYICMENDFKKEASNLSNSDIEQISCAIHSWKIYPPSTEGFRTAEVTLGGVDTDEISSKTFEAKKVEGLYFIGEVLDVTGHLGGFNFQWAWSSGYCAGSFV